MAQDEIVFYAFTDEAGRKGYIWKLTASNDFEVSLFVSLLIPVSHVDAMRENLAVPYQKFCNAAPPDARLHITDSFRRGNEAWATVAEKVRSEIFQIMLDCGLFLTYAARRLQISREMHELVETIKAQAKAERRSDFVILKSDDSLDSQVDDEVMLDLALMVDDFAEKRNCARAEFFFDEISAHIKERYEKAICRTKNIESSEALVKAVDPKTGQKHVAKMQFSAPAGSNATHLGGITVAGKTDPLIFAADVVTNSLWTHLQSLPEGSPLNVKASLQGWPLSDLAFVEPVESPFDQY